LEPYASDLCLVTDGQLPLRQCVHPQVGSKDIPLSSVFNEFYDLQKEFNRKYLKEGDDPMDLLQMGQCKYIIYIKHGAGKTAGYIYMRIHISKLRGKISYASVLVGSIVV